MVMMPTTYHPPIHPGEYREFLAWRSGQQHDGGGSAGEQQHAQPSWGPPHPYQPMPPPFHPAAAGRDAETMQVGGDASYGKTTSSKKKGRGGGGSSDKKTKKSPHQPAAAANPPEDGDVEREQEETTLDAPWADLCENADFVTPTLRGDIPDSLFVAISQFKPTALTPDDRIGKYKNREIGFTGLCCQHCGGQPGFGRYFPGSYDSFLNGTNCAGIVKHIKSDCLSCPPRVRDIVTELSLVEAQENLAAAAPPDAAESTTTTPQGRPRYGSRKRFFSYVWNKLRNTTVPVDDAPIGGQVQQEKPPKQQHGAEGDDDNITGSDVQEQLEKIVGASEIVSIQDRHLVSDVTLGKYHCRCIRDFSKSGNDSSRVRPLLPRSCHGSDAGLQCHGRRQGGAVQRPPNWLQGFVLQALRR